MDRLPALPTPRVVLSRESIWKLPIPDPSSPRPVALDRRGTMVLSAYAIYTDVDGLRDFDIYVRPVMRSLASSRSRSLLTLVMSPATFDAGLLRHSLASARELGIPSMVEVREVWGSTMLELLAAAGPSYVRLSPDFVHGAGSVPDVFRTVVSMAAFARERKLELVARNPRDAQELDAARMAGLELVQWGHLPIDGMEGDGGFRPTLVR